jgi:hypothetical protein
MLFIAEIILTIFAWRNGWKWLALLPIGILFLIGMVLGFGIAAGGGSIENISAGVIFFDIIAIIVLIIMVSKKKE